MTPADPLLKILNQVLQRAEDGDELEVILDEFPEHAEEIREFFAVQDFLTAQTRKEVPSKKALKQAIKQCFAPRKRAWGGWGALILWRNFSWQKSLQTVLPLLFVAVVGTFSLVPAPDPVQQEIARTIEQKLQQDIEAFSSDLEQIEEIQETDLFALLSEKNMGSQP